MKSSRNLYKVKVNPAETTLHWLWYQQCVHSPFKSFTFNISADTGLCSWLLSHSWDNRRFVRWRPEERFHVRGGSLQGRYQEYNMSRPRIKTNQFVQSDGFELVLTFPPLCFQTFWAVAKQKELENIQSDDQAPSHLLKCVHLCFNPFIIQSHLWFMSFLVLDIQFQQYACRQQPKIPSEKLNNI